MRKGPSSLHPRGSDPGRDPVLKATLPGGRRQPPYKSDSSGPAFPARGRKRKCLWSAYFRAQSRAAAAAQAVSRRRRRRSASSRAVVGAVRGRRGRRGRRGEWQGSGWETGSTAGLSTVAARSLCGAEGLVEAAMSPLTPVGRGLSTPRAPLAGGLSGGTESAAGGRPSLLCAPATGWRPVSAVTVPPRAENRAGVRPVEARVTSAVSVG